MVSLVVIGLTGCSTLELAHVDVRCIPLPTMTLGDRLTDEQLDSMSDEVFDAVEVQILTYKERLRSQCEINKKHDKLHR